MAQNGCGTLLQVLYITLHYYTYHNGTMSYTIPKSTKTAGFEVLIFMVGSSDGFPWHRRHQRLWTRHFLVLNFIEFTLVTATDRPKPCPLAYLLDPSSHSSDHSVLGSYLALPVWVDSQTCPQTVRTTTVMQDIAGHAGRGNSENN